MTDVHGLDLRDTTGPGSARPDHGVDELVEEERWIAEREAHGARFSLDDRRSA